LSVLNRKLPGKAATNQQIKACLPDKSEADMTADIDLFSNFP